MHECTGAHCSATEGCQATTQSMRMALLYSVQVNYSISLLCQIANAVVFLFADIRPSAYVVLLCVFMCVFMFVYSPLA